MHLKDDMMPRYAELIYNGFWFSPERLAIQALIDKTQEQVNGTVRLKLFKGQASVVGRKSPTRSTAWTTSPSRPTPSTTRKMRKASSS